MGEKRGGLFRRCRRERHLIALWLEVSLGLNEDSSIALSEISEYVEILILKEINELKVFGPKSEPSMSAPAMPGFIQMVIFAHGTKHSQRFWAKLLDSKLAQHMIGYLTLWHNSLELENIRRVTPHYIGTTAIRPPRSMANACLWLAIEQKMSRRSSQYGIG